MTTLPLYCQWTGEAFRPLGRTAKEADKQFVIGERYTLVEWQERSDPSHGHQFAWLYEAWKQLPESIADLYPTSEHLRKRALIQAGYYNEIVVDAGSNAAAVRVAAGFKKMDEFVLCVIRGAAVSVRTAKSQRRGPSGMNKADFNASKADIMEIIAELIGVKPSQLEQQAGMAA